MTLAPPELSVDAPGTAVPAERESARWNRAEVLEHVGVLGALGWLLWPATVAEGGRDAGSAAFLAIPTVLALVATAPWRRLTGRAWLLAPLVAVAALAVLPLTGVGRSGAVAALSYVLCAALLVSVAAYARTPARRATVAALLCAGGIAEFGWALVPWWGGADPTRPMVGTYFWHNQLAVALLLPALIGVSLAIAGKRPWRSVGWLAAPLGAAGVVLSTSRATLGCLVVGWLAVVAVSAFAAPQRRAGLLRALAVTALAVGLTFLLPGPPLFSTSSSPLSGTGARAAAGETVDANAAYRTQFWRESLLALKTHPLSGVGYGRIAADTDRLVPASWAQSSLSHSGPLQALGDGGLVLGLPVLAALAAIVLGLLRRLRLRPVGADQALVVAASLAALALVAHSLVDIDWTYPGLAAQFGVITGLVLATGRRGTDGSHHRTAMVGTGLLVLALVVGAVAAWSQPFHINNGISVSGGAQS